MPNSPRLVIAGVPLQEHQKPCPLFYKEIETADLIIGESGKVSRKWISKDKQGVLYNLDNPSPQEQELLFQKIHEVQESKGSVVLFSDTGMPLLFDPGVEILEYCRKLGFSISSIPGPTSWGTACALSGFAPPFWLEGFLPKENEPREKKIKSLVSIPACLVLMDTPYRFERLVSECMKVFKKNLLYFLAWELSSPEEKLHWGELKNLQTHAHQQGLKKGEFVLILRNYNC